MRFDRVRSVVQSLMSVYTEFMSRMKTGGDESPVRASAPVRMRKKALDKLNSTVSLLRQLLVSQGYCSVEAQSIPPLTASSAPKSPHGEVTCAICIDEIAEGNMVTELPCKHIYHRCYCPLYFLNIVLQDLHRAMVRDAIS